MEAQATQAAAEAKRPFVAPAIAIVNCVTEDYGAQKPCVT